MFTRVLTILTNFLALFFSVKPAVFDFFLAMLIAAYMGLIYLFVINFTRTMDTFHSIIGGIQHSTNSKSKST